MKGYRKRRYIYIYILLLSLAMLTFSGCKDSDKELFDVITGDTNSSQTESTESNNSSQTEGTESNTTSSNDHPAPTATARYMKTMSFPQMWEHPVRIHEIDVEGHLTDATIMLPSGVKFLPIETNVIVAYNPPDDIGPETDPDELDPEKYYGVSANELFGKLHVDPSKVVDTRKLFYEGWITWGVAVLKEGTGYPDKTITVKFGSGEQKKVLMKGSDGDRKFTYRFGSAECSGENTSYFSFIKNRRLIGDKLYLPYEWRAKDNPVMSVKPDGFDGIIGTMDDNGYINEKWEIKSNGLHVLVSSFTIKGTFKNLTKTSVYTRTVKRTGEVLKHSECTQHGSAIWDDWKFEYMDE